jgi:hypothetical protein
VYDVSYYFIGHYPCTSTAMFRFGKINAWNKSRLKIIDVKNVKLDWEQTISL